MLLFRTVIILSDVIANIAKNDCEMADVMALFRGLITILAAILNFLHRN